MTGDDIWWLKDENVVLCDRCNTYNEDLNKSTTQDNPRYHSGNDVSNDNGQRDNGQRITTTTPTPIAPSREEAIAKAHAENMSANIALVGAVLELARQVEERSRLLKKQMEAKA
jgi:hypothetical protein